MELGMGMVGAIEGLTEGFGLEYYIYHSELQGFQPSL